MAFPSKETRLVLAVAACWTFSMQAMAQGFQEPNMAEWFGSAQPRNPFEPVPFYENPTNWLLAALVVIAGIGLYLYSQRNNRS